MINKVDKSLILNKIKSHYLFKKDIEFAQKLGIAQSTLANWFARNTFDPEIIISKCEDIDANWLLTGKGDMLKKTYQFEKSSTVLAEPKEMYNVGELEALKRLALTQEKTIKLLEDVIDQNKRSEIIANDPARSLQKQLKPSHTQNK